MILWDNNLINVTCDESNWVVDHGSCFLVTPRQDFFTSYTPVDYGVLNMGNDSLSKVVGIEIVVWKPKLECN